MTKIDIISGFLGAGKTTLIKKLLQEALAGTKVVLIENEFGEIGIDGGFLKDAGIEIKEMNSGCICCSLVGDFGASLKEVLAKYTPERIIIEPSGVGKLSDVMAAVKNATEHDDAELGSAVAVVDAKKAKMYIKNFGEFFVNQIAHAGTIVLSRTDQLSDEKVAEVVDMLRVHNQKATVITTPWPKLQGSQILQTIEGASDLEAELMEEALRAHAEHEHEHHHHHHDHDHEHEHHHEHEHEHDHDHEHDHEHEHEHHHEHDHDHEHEHHHDHEHHHHHDHDADEIFTSLGMETVARFTKEQIEKILSELEHEEEYGMILRAKGIVAGADAWIHFDYTPGETDVREGSADVTGKICVIGADLKEDAIRNLFLR
ncbi:MAG: GTP-binding protein [Lachnospiraceae bacterium]|nr:GTP-binding protein [Lachnospiraceae bacterium]